MSQLDPSLWRPPLGSHSLKKKKKGHECVLRRICFLVLLGMLPWLVIPRLQATLMPSCRRRSSSSQSLWSTQWEGGSTLTTTQVRLGCEEEFLHIVVIISSCSSILKCFLKNPYLMNNFMKSWSSCSKLSTLIPKYSSGLLHTVINKLIRQPPIYANAALLTPLAIAKSSCVCLFLYVLYFLCKGQFTFSLFFFILLQNN